MHLKLDLNELVELCTYDNRRLSIKCTKSVNGVPVLDLLPRVRYLLRANASSRTNTSRSVLFFTQGLIVIPEEGSSTSDLRVAVLNMSEKAVRISAGSELGEDDLLQCKDSSGAIRQLPDIEMSTDRRAYGQYRS